MDKAFWIKKWEDESDHAFHQKQYHPQLTEYFPTLELPKGSSVLVPLCGKTLDLLWLKNQGYKVIGVELSPIAGKEFFEENKLSYQSSSQNGFEVLTGDNIIMYCGDFFELQNLKLPKVDAIYDRAALVALPIEMRLNYYKAWKELLSPKGQVLLITFEYDYPEVSGPPFSITRTEIGENTPDHILKELFQNPVEIRSKKFIKANATKAIEFTLRLRPR